MFPKVTRGTLADQVTKCLLEFIDSHNLKPGDLLPSESSLAANFEVSRPVIREALKNLEGKGFIEIVNGKGSLVKPIDSNPLRIFFERAVQMEHGTILELMEIRKGLEVQAAMLAAQRRDENDLEAIRKVVQAMRENLHEMEQYTLLDVEFHLLIAAASHNTMMVHLIHSIRDALRNTISVGLQSRGTDSQLEVIQRTHEVLVETIEKGEVEASMQAMSRHFDEAISAMVNPQSHDH